MSKTPLERPEQIQLVAGALMASVVIHAAAGVWLSRSGVLPEGGLLQADQDTANIIGLAMLAAGSTAAFFSFFLRPLMIQRLAPNGYTLQSIMQAVIVSLALAEAPGVLGLVLAILTTDLAIPAVLWGISFGVSLFHFPTKTWIENLLEGGSQQ